MQAASQSALRDRSSAEQGAHLVQRHVHGAAQADEAQLVQVGLAVEPVAVVAALGRRDQALRFVVADVGGAHAAALRRLADAITLHVGRPWTAMA